MSIMLSVPTTGREKKNNVYDSQSLCFQISINQYHMQVLQFMISDEFFR